MAHRSALQAQAHRSALQARFQETSQKPDAPDPGLLLHKTRDPRLPSNQRFPTSIFGRVRVKVLFQTLGVFGMKDLSWPLRLPFR